MSGAAATRVAGRTFNNSTSASIRKHFFVSAWAFVKACPQASGSVWCFPKPFWHCRDWTCSLVFCPCTSPILSQLENENADELASDRTDLPPASLRLVEAKFAKGCEPFNCAMAFFAFEADARQAPGLPISNSEAQDLIGTDHPSGTNLSFVCVVVVEEMGFIGFQSQSMGWVLCEILPPPAMRLGGWTHADFLEGTGGLALSAFPCFWIFASVTKMWALLNESILKAAEWLCVPLLRNQCRHLSYDQEEARTVESEVEPCMHYVARTTHEWNLRANL